MYSIFISMIGAVFAFSLCEWMNECLYRETHWTSSHRAVASYSLTLSLRTEKNAIYFIKKTPKIYAILLLRFATEKHKKNKKK